MMCFINIWSLSADSFISLSFQGRERVQSGFLGECNCVCLTYSLRFFFFVFLFSFFFSSFFLFLFFSYFFHLNFLFISFIFFLVSFFFFASSRERDIKDWEFIFFKSLHGKLNYSLLLIRISNHTAHLYSHDVHTISEKEI